MVGDEPLRVETLTTENKEQKHREKGVLVLIDKEEIRDLMRETEAVEISVDVMVD